MDGGTLKRGEWIDCLKAFLTLCHTGAKDSATEYQGLDLFSLVPRSVVGFFSRNIQLEGSSNEKRLIQGQGVSSQQ